MNLTKMWEKILSDLETYGDHIGIGCPYPRENGTTKCIEACGFEGAVKWAKEQLLSIASMEENTVHLSCSDIDVIWDLIDNALESKVNMSPNQRELLQSLRDRLNETSGVQINKGEKT